MIRFQSIFTSFPIQNSCVRSSNLYRIIYAFCVKNQLQFTPISRNNKHLSDRSLQRTVSVPVYLFHAVLCQKKDDTRYGCHPVAFDRDAILRAVVFDIHVYYSIIDIELSKSNGALRFFHDASPAAGSSTENSSPLPFSSTVTRQPSMISPLMIITARRFSTLFCRYRLIGLAP